MSKTYKTESVAKTQATKQHGKNWQENWSIFESEEGFEIVAKLPEPPAEVVVQMDQTEPEAANSDEEELEEVAPQNGSLMSSLIGNMMNPETIPQAPAAPKKEAEKTGKTIEPNRAEQNGLKRPSKGSTCAIIWDTCDRITSEKGSTCTSAELFNALQGYNDCTLRTQYARWRQFNGITGRLPGQTKTAKLPPEFQDAVDTIRVRIADDNTKAIESLEACKTPNEFIAWIAANASSF